MNREQIINNMCVTFRHDYGLRISEDDRMYTLTSGMTEREAQELFNTMSQIFDNDIAPYVELKSKYKFTGSHFTDDGWETYLSHLTEKFGSDLICVELGAFEGMSSLHILDNFVGDNGHLYTIDYFLMDYVKQNFKHNINLHPKKNQVSVLEGSTITELPKLLSSLTEKVHFLYIDAGKTAMDNIYNLAIAERLLAVDGILLVDDYEWDRDKNVDPKKAPRSAVDWFKENSLLCTPFRTGYQAAFLKRNANDSILIYNR